MAISHLHPDHYFDLVPLYYMLKFGEPRPADVEPRLAVYVPPGGRAFLSRLGEHIADKPAMLEDVFDLCEYAPDSKTRIGGLRVHLSPGAALRPVARDARALAPTATTLVFSSDVGAVRRS